MKACPACHAQLPDAVTACKHCGTHLDGRPRAVHVTKADPFAELHTPIQGKASGAITVVGYLGIGVGVLAIVAAGMALTMVRDGGFGALIMALMGGGFIVASYLWARR